MPVTPQMMTPEDVVTRYGDRAWRDEDYVVRVSRKEDGTIRLLVHNIEGDKEVLPRGYVIGSNCLILEPKPARAEEAPVHRTRPFAQRVETTSRTKKVGRPRTSRGH
jgi:hypothetical protein